MVKLKSYRLKFGSSCLAHVLHSIVSHSPALNIMAASSSANSADTTPAPDPDPRQLQIQISGRTQHMEHLRQLRRKKLNELREIDEAIATAGATAEPSSVKKKPRSEIEPRAKIKKRRHSEPPKMSDFPKSSEVWDEGTKFRHTDGQLWTFDQDEEKFVVVPESSIDDEC